MVFNKVRGILMAVAEIATSHSRSSGETSGRTIKPWAVQAATVRALAMLGLVIWPVIGQAQITADPSAPATQRPTILAAPNGVPLVNIQTPSAAGVSRNTYSQFDVQQQGAILNNSRINAQTQLGGWVQGNPWLATGSARVILNEVNSSNPSLLQGYVEVAGSRAQVVIANPAGVTCDGCGFINASRATVTTGTPILNGGNLDGYRVQDGVINIAGAGLDTSTADYTDLIARSVQVNAGIWANQLKVTAGANQVDAEHTAATPIAGTGAAPAFAIDVVQLGGMYAGKITLVGTETGVGVRNAGNIGASVGEVIVTAEGWLENAGRITSASHTQIDTSGIIDNSGTIYAQGNASVGTRDNIDNSGVIAALCNVTLAATGAISQITSTNSSVLGAGVQSDGSLGNSGALGVNATQSIVALGQNLSGGDQSMTSKAIDLSGSQTSAGNLNLAASQADVNLTGAIVSASQTLTANAGQTLRADQASLSAWQINAAAHDLSNVQGEIVQVGSGDMTLALLGNLDNSQGRIATNSANLNLGAVTLTNTGGSLEHAGTGALTIAATTFNGVGGQISSNGLLNLAATIATLDNGTTSVEQVQINTSTLSNRGGIMVQTGTGAASISAATQLDNTGGDIVSNGPTTLTVGDLANQGGTIQAVGNAAASLQINATGAIDNSAVGNIAASGGNTITANSLNNTLGQITAGQGLSVATSQTLTNAQGLLAANQQVSISASQIDNSQGTIGSVQGQTKVTATGALNNSAGHIEAAQALEVSAFGVNNTDGVISGSSVSANSNALAFDNTRGKLATTGASDSGALDIDSGALTNEEGLIQAAGALGVNTRGHVLTNTHSGNSGGIIGQSSVSLTTGALNNLAGYIGSNGQLSSVNTAISNTQGGILTSVGQMSLSGSSLDNQGGQIQAVSDIDLSLSGALNNTASLVRSGQALDIAAGSIVNANTQGNNQGLEGQSVSLTAAQINNQQGAVRADNALTMTSHGSINNTQGLISSGDSVTLQDSNLAAKTLTVTNTSGTVIAGQQLDIDGAGLTGDGKVLSQGDLNVKLTQNYTHTGELQATGTASLETAGTLTNQSTLLAGTALNLKAASIDNQANGQIKANQVNLKATSSQTLTNRGLIDGHDTVIETPSLNNLGTGRIYGDHLAIGATTVTNSAENGAAPVIAARDRLDIGATTITNREHALLFSAGDMFIGGGLDANKHATGQAAILNNNSATIEVLGDMAISAATVNNTNDHFSAYVEFMGTESIVEYQGGGASSRYKAGTPGVYLYVDESLQLHTPEGNYESWLSYNYSRSTTETKVQSSDPAQILSGAAMRITAATLLNDKSRVIAGGTLTGTLGTFNNTEVSGNRTFTDIGTVTSYWRDNQKGRDETGSSTSGYSPAPIIQAISINPTVYKQNTAPTGTGLQVSSLTIDSLNQSADGAHAAGVTISHSQVITPITQVAALNGNNASGPATVVRSGGVNISMPNNSLFGVSATPNSSYLVETDQRFADYRQWLSSDYLLNAMAIDPDTMQKRLGDGFYEQRLIREQVAMLTGRRLLEGYADDEAQFRALMSNGATFAQAHQLRPGIALTAEQMVQLTSDIVWLVEKEITLASGQTTRAMVPQVYARVQDGDLSASGALIAGRNINLNLAGDLSNSGTIVGRDVVALTAENVKNLGGRLAANDVAVSARNDLDNIGGVIEGGNSLAAIAGRDLNVISTTSNQRSAQGSRTNVSRVAGLYVTSAGGTLLASAGNDVNLIAAGILNTAPAVAGQPAGSTTIAAGNNLNLGTVSESASNTIVWDAKNYRSDASRTDVGTTIQTQGDLTLQAGHDLNARAVSVTSDQGVLLAMAGGSVNLTAGEANNSVDEAHQHSSKGFLSKKTTTTRDTLNETTALGTTLSGDTTTVLADQDISLKGSNVVATRDVNIAAGNNINIEAASNSRAESHFVQEKKSGLLGGGIGFTIGTQKQSTDSKGESTTASASTVGSTAGNVTIEAGKNYKQTGSEVLAPQSDIDISAQKIDIVEAQNTNKTETETKFSKSGVTIAITSPVVSAIQTASQMGKAASQTKDGRMKALAGATAGLSAKNAYDAVTADPSAGGGVGVSIMFGGSKSESKEIQSSSVAAGSTVAAGHDINLTATGAGKDSDLTIQGGNVTAGNDITLKADDDITLLAAKNTAEQYSTNKSSSGGVGVSVTYGSNGFAAGVTLSASGARGKADGKDETWTNTHVEADNKLTMESGGDTTLKGAVASGKQVVADIGGDLKIESLQDTSKYDSKQQSIGGSVTIGYGFSASANASKSNINSDYASVTEQSGIKAGDEGFQVNVAGNTGLKGAVIASTDKAVEDGKNTLVTASLMMSDVENRADYKASSFGIGGSGGVGSSTIPLGGGSAPAAAPASGAGAEGANVVTAPVSGGKPTGSAGFGHDTGSAASTTRSGVSGIAGNKDVRTGDKETGIARIFDADKVQKEVDAQTQITQAFGQVAPKAIADYADSQTKDYTSAKLQKQAAEAALANTSDPQNRAQIEQAIAQADQTMADNQSQYDLWKEGGAYRVALHTATGALTGGAQGALGAGAAAGAAPLMEQLQTNVQTALSNAGANETVARAAGQLITQGAATGLGAAVSGGSTAGAAMAFNVDTNNRQLHPSEEKWLKDKAKLFAKQQKQQGNNITEDEALARLTQQVLRDVDVAWRALSAGNDAEARAFLSTAKQQTFINELGERQSLFTASTHQFFRPELFADTADTAFYKLYAQPGINRSLRDGMTQVLKDYSYSLGGKMVAGAKAGLQAYIKSPQAVSDALDKAVWDVAKSMPGIVMSLPGAVVDGFKETGEAIGQGAAVAVDNELTRKLNSLYGVDVSTEQRALLGVRTVLAGAEAVGTTKVVKTIGEEVLEKVGPTLAKTAGNISDKALNSAAVHFLEQNASTIKGFSSAEELNAVMKNYGKDPSWKTGTTVADTIIAPGTKVNMVMDKAAYLEYVNNDRVGMRFGGWATFDDVPSKAYARNQLAITQGMKEDVSYVVELELVEPVQAKVGIVGAQGGAAGGGNQLQFIIPPTDRSSVFKVIGERKLK
jgi:filamentous hemagglutinin